MKSKFKPFEANKQYPRLLQSENVIILAIRYNSNSKLYSGTIVGFVTGYQGTYELGEYREDWVGSCFVNCSGTITLSN